MYFRPNHFRLTLLASVAAAATLLGAGVLRAANTPPLADAWNITSSGEATSSGELLFRVSGEGGRKPVEVTVYVLSGSNETGVASSIRRALATQLEGQRLNIQPGEGANVLLSAAGQGRGFSVELLDSDVENIRVTVQSATPIAPPTVAPQQLPATPPASPRTPAAPGDATPAGEPDDNRMPAPPDAPAPASPALPSSPSADPAPSAPRPDEQGSGPPDGAAGVPASARPPAPGPGS